MKISFFKDEPIILAALAAKISKSPLEKSVEETYEELRDDKKRATDFINKIIKKYNHLIFADFVGNAIAFEEISRLAAIYFWRNVNTFNEIFGAGIETSLRIVKPNKFLFEDPLFYEAKEIYDKAIEKGIKEEDARYVLPEATLTRILFFSPPRYLLKLAKTFDVPLEEFQNIKRTIEKIVEENFNITLEEEVPTKWKFYKDEEKINDKEKINLHMENNDINSLYLSGVISGSLAMYAQLVRQRQILCVIEPFEEIVERREFVLPASFDKEIEREYKNFAKKINEKQRELVRKKNFDFVYYLLLGQIAKAKIYGYSSGIIKLSRSRACGTAQWEIRNTIGIKLLEEMKNYDEISNEIGPKCYREKKCVEPKTFKKECKIFQEFKGQFNNLTLDETIEKLKVNYETFKL